MSLAPHPLFSSLFHFSGPIDFPVFTAHPAFWPMLAHCTLFPLPAWKPRTGLAGLLAYAAQPPHFLISAQPRPRCSSPSFGRRPSRRLPAERRRHFQPPHAASWPPTYRRPLLSQVGAASTTPLPPRLLSPSRK
jgi:hypothetical protein